MALGLVIVFGLLFWGEKIVLAVLRARYMTDDEHLLNQVKNLCCHLKISGVKLYWSNTFVNNVYYTSSPFGSPSLVIGKNVYKVLRRNELISLINASLIRTKSKEASKRTLASLVFVILYSPVLILSSFFYNTRFNFFASSFMYPAFFLKQMIYENSNELTSFDCEVSNLDGLKKDYISALYKVAGMKEIREFSVASLMVSELVHIQNDKSDVLRRTIDTTIALEDRIKNINSI